MKRAVVGLLLLLIAGSAHAETTRTIAGSLQLDYLSVPTEFSRAPTRSMRRPSSCH